MGASIFACTLPGSVSTAASVIGWAFTVSTVTTACASVCSLSFTPATCAAYTVQATTRIATTPMAMLTRVMPREVARLRGRCEVSMARTRCVKGTSGGRRTFGRMQIPVTAVNAREDRRHEEKGRYGCKQETADDGASERRILLATLAEPERHRQHADDHGERGHQHGAKAREARLERRLGGAQAVIHPLAREADEQEAVRGRNPHAHDGAGECRHAQCRARDEQRPHDAGDGAGQGRDDDEGIQPRLEIDHDEEVHEKDRAREPDQESRVRRRHRLHLAARDDVRALREFTGLARENAIDVLRDGAEVAALYRAKDVDDGLGVVVRNDGRAEAARDGRESAENLGLAGGIDGYVVQILERRHA